MRRNALLTLALMALGALAFEALRVPLAHAQTGFPLKSVRTLTTTCFTVDATTGGTRIPSSPAANRISLGLFAAGAQRAYCVPTLATTCAVAASVTNYGVILEGAAGADQMGGFWSAWLLNSVNFCCATIAGTTKVCTQEGVL